MYPIKVYQMTTEEKNSSASNELASYIADFDTCTAKGLKPEERFYFYRLFPKLKDYENADVSQMDPSSYGVFREIVMSYREKIYYLQRYGFDSITLITSIGNDEVVWYSTDRKQIINGVHTNIRTFLDQEKTNLSYGLFFTTEQDYRDESVNSEVIEPAYKFTVNYNLDENNPTYEIADKTIMVRHLDFDPRTLPAKEDIENPEWEFSDETIQDLKTQKVKVLMKG